MSYDAGDCAEGFADAAEELLSTLSLYGVSNLPKDAQAAYSTLNNALSDYQEYLEELNGKADAASWNLAPTEWPTKSPLSYLGFGMLKPGVPPNPTSRE